MELVLWLYSLDYDEAYPIVCFDERPCQLLNDVISPIPMKPGSCQKQDYHYERQGTCCLLLAVEPKAGWRMVETSEQKTAKDYTRFMQRLAAQYPRAKKIRLVQDNLNTHTAASFYKYLEAKQAFDLAQRFEWYYTPKKASWLNMAEIELSAIARTCLQRRIGSIQFMEKEVSQLVKERNAKKISINWQFGIEAARDKFERFYTEIITRN